MNITLTGNKIMQDTKFLAFEKNNGVDVINITVDTDESWSYKLDVKYPEKCCTGEELYNIINLNRDGDICSVELTSKMLPFAGKYTMQLRAINGDKVKHSDTFDAWIKYSIEPGSTYDPVSSEFYQIEQNITEMNNHPPKPGQNGYWLVWDITTSQYKESDIPLPDGMLPEVTADTSGKYLSNDGKKAYWTEVQTGTESKIDKIEVNGVEQPIVDKTVNIAVPTKTSNLSNDSGYITNEALDGYATKAELPTKVSQLENDSKFINESALDGYAKTDDIPTKTSQLTNDTNYITAAQSPVQSVNNKTGAVSLTASDVGALPADTVIPTVNNATLTIKRNSVDVGSFTANAANDVNIDINVPTNKSDIGLGNVDNVRQYSAQNPPPYPVTSVNGHTGAVTLSATDVSAIPSTLTGTAGQVLTKTVDGQEWKDVDIPTALPNPNALTFMGAATGTYDGSAPLTVNIPAGGGGGGSSDKWELINTITVSDDATTNVTFTQDSAGNPFALKKLYLKISGINGGSTYPAIRLNGLHWTEQFGGIVISLHDNMTISVLFELLGNGIYIWEWANPYARDIRRTGERAPGGGTQSLIETINSVMWLWGTNSAITNGSVFTLYGVRA